MVDLTAYVYELSTLDVVCLAVLAIVAYRWFIRSQHQIEPPVFKKITKLPMHDLTVSELKEYDGQTKEHILLAVNRVIYDVTRSESFYGKGGSYEKLGGHDATRALGSMKVDLVKEEWDDYERITAEEKETATEWQESFNQKYATVGRLVEKEEDKKDYDGKQSGIGSLFE